MPDKQDPSKPKRDPNQPLPKEPPKSSFGAKLGKLLLLVVLFLATAAFVAYSLRIERGPWAWSGDDWKGFLTFSQEKAKAAGDEIASYDWANLKTKVTDRTKQLWSDAPEVGRRIEEKLGGKTSATPTGTPAQPGDKTSASVPSAPADSVSPEHKLALESMRSGISHYRKSPDDANELQAAKKDFESASGHFEKALKETTDDKAKSDIEQELKDCNKYLEDCRAREKP